MISMRVYSIKDIMEEYQNFYDMAFNRGSVGAARNSLYQLKTYLTEYYVSRGKDPSEVEEKVDEMIGVLNMDTSYEGKKKNLMEKIMELNQLLREIEVGDPIKSAANMIDEFNEVWREFMVSPTAKNGSAIQNIIRNLEDLKPYVAEYAREKDKGIYDKYVMMLKAAGKVRGSIHSVELVGERTPSRVQENVEDFFDKANEFTSYIGDLVTERIEEEEEEEEEVLEKVPPELKEMIERGSVEPVTKKDLELE